MRLQGELSISFFLFSATPLFPFICVRICARALIRPPEVNIFLESEACSSSPSRERSGYNPLFRYAGLLSFFSKDFGTPSACFSEQYFFRLFRGERIFTSSPDTSPFK